MIPARELVAAWRAGEREAIAAHLAADPDGALLTVAFCRELAAQGALADIDHLTRLLVEEMHKRCDAQIEFRARSAARLTAVRR